MRPPRIRSHRPSSTTAFSLKGHVERDNWHFSSPSSSAASSSDSLSRSLFVKTPIHYILFNLKNELQDISSFITLTISRANSLASMLTCSSKFITLVSSPSAFSTLHYNTLAGDVASPHNMTCVSGGRGFSSSDASRMNICPQASQVAIAQSVQVGSRHASISSASALIHFIVNPEGFLVLSCDLRNP